MSWKALLLSLLFITDEVLFRGSARESIQAGHWKLIREAL